jgi:hypothetical protein
MIGIEQRKVALNKVPAILISVVLSCSIPITAAMIC